MEYEKYNYILTDGAGIFLAESPGKTKPKIIGDANGHEWHEWNKPIPDNILQAEPGVVKYENGELVKE